VTARTRPRSPKPATEQPGNSFRYLYWRLSEGEFQQLCGALLRLKFDPVRCFPMGMADEGIDAISDGSTIYQVKWSSKLEQNPDQWLRRAVEGEPAYCVMCAVLREGDCWRSGGGAITSTRSRSTTARLLVRCRPCFVPRPRVAHQPSTGRDRDCLATLVTLVDDAHD
jgi:hypothetical protein